MVEYIKINMLIKHQLVRDVKKLLERRNFICTHQILKSYYVTTLCW